MARRLLVVLLGIVLVVSLFGANVVWAVDRGPFDRDHVTASAEESDIYAEMQSEVLEQLAEEELTLPYPGLDNRADEIVALVVTADWMQSEAERNVYNLFDHLERDEPLELYIDFEGHREHVEETVATEFRLADLEIDRLDRLVADEQSYLSERAELRAALLGEIGVDPDDGFGVPTIQGLLESPEGYEQTRGDVRADIADEALDALDADAGFGNERLAGMYDDPETYATEQADFRAQEKDRIQEETDDDLSDEELEDIYTDQQAEIEEAAVADAVEGIDFEDAPEPAQDRAEELAVLKAEALATGLSHDEFTDRYDGIVADVGDDVVTDVAENPEDYADDVDDHVRAELDEADVPEALEDDVGAIADVTVEAITTDMTHEAYLAAYDEAVADVEAAGVEHISENRDEYDEELQGAGLGEFDRADVPESLEPAIDAVVDLVLEAVVTEMDYDPFVTQMDEREENLGSSLGNVLFDEEMIPHRLELTEDVLDGAGDELEVVGQAMGLVTPIAVLLSGLALLLVGGIFAVTRDVATTALVGGSSSLAVGVPSVAVASLVPDLIADAMTDVDVPDGLQEASVELIELVVFSPLQGQGIVLIGLGGLLIGAVVVVRLDLVDLPLDD